jgi:hypothetical protein
MESYERMLTVLETNLGLVRHKAYPHPLSVVVTKVDALDLETQIGEPAARVMLMRNRSIGSEADAIHSLVRDFLSRYGLENFVRDVDHQFASARFFSCSALGRMPGPSADKFIPVRALDPLQSILTQVGVLDENVAQALSASQAHTV